MAEKWIINDDGEVEDTTTHMTFDSFWELLIVLNAQSRLLNQLSEENEQLKERITDKNIETEIEIGKYIEKVLKVIDEENEKYWLKEKTSLRKEAKIYNSFRRSLTKIGMELF